MTVYSKSIAGNERGRTQSHLRNFAERHVRPISPKGRNFERSVLVLLDPLAGLTGFKAP